MGPGKVKARAYLRAVGEGLALEPLERLHHLGVVAHHAAQAPHAPVRPQPAQEERLRVRAELLFGPLGAGAPGHVGHRHGRRRTRLRVVRLRLQAQPADHVVRVGAHLKQAWGHVRGVDASVWRCGVLLYRTRAVLEQGVSQDATVMGAAGP
jgi:hypothetical protein